jgi:hypothetical protein
MKKKTTKKIDILQQVANYIESIGGKVIVIGGTRIRQRDLKYNFTFEVDFTGNFPISTEQ